jgi:hypothetical protein
MRLLQSARVGILARNSHFSVSELPRLAQLRVLRVREVDDLAAVLIQGTNLRWLDVAAAKGMVLSSSQQQAGMWSTNLQVLNLCLTGSEEDSLGYMQLIDRMCMPRLMTMTLRHWPSPELPRTVCQTYSLLCLDLTGSHRLKRLPQQLGDLVDLKWLTLTGCSTLPELPKSITDLLRLERFDLDECSSLEKLPESIGKLQSLEILDLSGCTSLLSLPDSLTQLQRLRALDLSDCTNINCLPTSLGDMQLKWFGNTGLLAAVPPDCMTKLRTSGK